MRALTASHCHTEQANACVYLPGTCLGRLRMDLPREFDAKVLLKNTSPHTALKGSLEWDT